MKKYLITIAFVLFKLCSFSQNILSEQKFKNFETFSKLYGYVRYYYPGETFLNNWEKFAIFGLKKIENAANENDLKDSLKDLFSIIAPEILIYNTGENIDDFIKIMKSENSKNLKHVSYQYSAEDLIIENQLINRVRVNNKNFSEIYCELPPDSPDDSIQVKRSKNPRKLFDEEAKIDDYLNKEIGYGLSCVFPLVLNADNEGTIPKVNKVKYQRLKNDLFRISDDPVKSDSIYVRVADIVITWNILKHHYPYFKELMIDWNSVLYRYLKYACNNKNNSDFLLTLKKLVVQMKDGQATVSNNDFFVKQYFPGFNCKWIDFRLVVTNSWDSASKFIQKGDIVMEINNMPSLKLIENEEAYISGINLQFKRNLAISNILRGMQNSIIKLKIQKHDGTIKNLDLIRNNDNATYTENSQNKIKYKEIGEGVFYINMEGISKEEIKEVLPQMKQAKSIICDLRNYSTCLNNEFLCYILTSRDTSKPWNIPHILYPDFEKVLYKKVGEEFKPLKPHLNAKFVFITDGSAEYFLNFVSGYKLGTIIGNTTYGDCGDLNFFKLPGGYNVQYTKSKVLKLDGSQLFGVGIKPDITVSETFKGILEGKDEYLDAAISYLKSGKGGN